MKIMTETEALKITAELWDWLATHPEAEKSDWEGWEKYGSMPNECPLCEYSMYHAVSDAICSACPLVGNWGWTPHQQIVHCVDREGLFFLWHRKREQGEKATEYALRIAERCREVMQELPIWKERER